MPSTMYFQFFRFLLPLILTLIVQELSRQFLSGGMARMPQATETLASYGLAWGLVLLFSSPLAQVKQLGLVLVDSPQSFRKLRNFVLITSLLLVGILANLAFGPIGAWVIEDLHNIHAPISITVRRAIFWLLPFPVLLGFNLFYSGLILRVRHTEVISYATISNISISIITVFVLLPLGFIQRQPIFLPLLVAYAGILIEFAIIFWGYRRYKEKYSTDAGQKILSFSSIIRFFWPLALIMGIQGISRPVINLFISRGPDGPEALAILAVVYSLGRLPYGWLNEIRCLAPAFRENVESLRSIRYFSVGCGVFSFCTMFVLFWTPVRSYILETLIGLEANLAARCAIPLFIFSFFPLTVATRAYFHGVGLVERRTKAMAPSAPARMLAIVFMLVLLGQFEMHGATRGIAALFAGFAAEALVVWWGIRRRG
ncbi:MAG: hypothetical protein GY801_05380 [bacterium]|nr:hypothetical protein [bacterium]